jgi:3-phytase
MGEDAAVRSPFRMAARWSSGTRWLVGMASVVSGVAVLALVLGGVTALPDDDSPLRTATAHPAVETESLPGSGDVADDSAIWVNEADPARSVVVAGSKSESDGGVAVFDMQGRLRQFLAGGKIGNVDLRVGFRLGGREVVLVGANERASNQLRFWTLDPATSTLSPVESDPVHTWAPNYGFCLYQSGASGKTYAFVTPDGPGDIQQFELSDNGSGRIGARLVRTLPVSSTTEGCVADDEAGRLYVGQEAVAVWRYGAEPDAGTAHGSVDVVGGELAGDIEGMSIIYGARGGGYLVVSSQGDSTFAVYDRAGDNRYAGSFTAAASGEIDEVTQTDGVDATSRSAGPGFEDGLLVIHDAQNDGGETSNLKYVPLGQLLTVEPPT